MVKNPPSNAEDAGSGLGLGTKISHAPGRLLNPHALKPTCHNSWALHNSTNIPHDAVKILPVSTQTRCSQINKQKTNQVCHRGDFTSFIHSLCNIPMQLFLASRWGSHSLSGNPGSIHIKALHFLKSCFALFSILKERIMSERILCVRLGSGVHHSLTFLQPEFNHITICNCKRGWKLYPCTQEEKAYWWTGILPRPQWMTTAILKLLLGKPFRVLTSHFSSSFCRLSL